MVDNQNTRPKRGVKTKERVRQDKTSKPKRTRGDQPSWAFRPEETDATQRLPQPTASSLTRYPCRTLRRKRGPLERGRGLCRPVGKPASTAKATETYGGAGDSEYEHSIRGKWGGPISLFHVFVMILMVTV